MLCYRTLGNVLSHLTTKTYTPAPIISARSVLGRSHISPVILQQAVPQSTFTQPSNPNHEIIEDKWQEELILSKEVIAKVNKHIADGEQGRLFAIVQILGKQYKVTQEDLLLIQHFWAPTVKDEVRLEKVLVVGGSSFTLLGKPILPRSLVNITATVLMKDLTHSKIRYYYRPKKRIHNLNFVREELTYLRIKKIEVFPTLDEEVLPEEVSRV